MKTKIEEEAKAKGGPDTEDAVVSETNSIVNGQAAKAAARDSKSTGIILDVCRELRIKLYIGQVFMGWLWIIPAFHMPYPRPGQSPSSSSAAPTSTKLLLTRKDLDFPLGIGAGIIDLQITMEWVAPAQVVNVVEEPSARQTSQESREEGTAEPAGAGLIAAIIGGGDVGGTVGDAVRAEQGAEE